MSQKIRGRKKKVEKSRFFFYSEHFETRCNVIGKKNSSIKRSSSLVEICSIDNYFQSSMTTLKEQQHCFFNCCSSLELAVILLKFERKNCVSWKNLFFFLQVWKRINAFNSYAV